MKKINSILMAAALMAGSLTSCTVNDEIDTQSSQLTPSNKEIKFTTGITRGTAFTGTSFGASDTYKVYAYSGSTKYIDGITYPGGSSYWPESGTLQFLALYPASLTPAVTYTESETKYGFSYTASTTIGNQVDLMAATASGSKTSDAVALNFSHLLSQISVKAKAATSLTVNIQSVEIHNVKTTGTFNGTELTAEEALSNYAISFTAQDLPSDGSSVDLTSTDVLLLVPQTTSAWPTTAGSACSISYNDGESGSKGSYIKVVLTVKNGSDYVLGTDEAAATIYFPLAISWEKQKHYTYELCFGSSSSDTDGYGYDGAIGDDDTEGSGNPHDADLGGGEGQTAPTVISFSTTVSSWTDVTAEEITF